MGYLTFSFILIGAVLVTETMHIVRAIIWYVRYYKLKHPQMITTTITDNSLLDKNSRLDTATVVISDNDEVPADRVFCRKCGKEIPNDSTFCPKCGERVISTPRENVNSIIKKDLAISEVHERVCKCGFVVNSQYARWCPKCGEKLPAFEK